MPIFQDHSEDGKPHGNRFETLNPKNISRYLSEHSVERVKGYQDALTDILEILGPKIWTTYEHDDKSFYPTGHTTVRRSMLPIIDAFFEQDNLFSQLSRLVSENQSSANNDMTKLEP